MRIHRGALALTLCAALEAAGCGGPRGPVRPAPLTGHTQHYQPLGMKADARLAGQAVILGTDETDGSWVMPIPTTPSTAVVDAMFVTHGGPESVNASSIAVTLTTAPAAPAPATSPAATTTAPAAPPPAVQEMLPIVTTDPSAGVRWRQELWSAAFVAASALGKDLHEVTFSALPSPPGDDAAAALLAGGFLATLTGEPIDPAATLAGMLNPDGTIGPVAGIPEQFLSALAHDKTRLGYPSGMRFARSQATGEEVDLVQLARGHHAEAIELANVYDAYQLLTHKQLPAPVPVSEADMALDPDTVKLLDTKYLAWQKRLAGEWTQLLQLEQAGRLPAAIGLLVRSAQDRSEQAETLYRAGKLPAAYGHILTAWVYAAGANHTYAVVAKLATGDLDGALAALAAIDTAGADTGALLGKLGALRPQALAGHLAMLAAFQAALRGLCTDVFAKGAIRATTQFLAGFRDKPATEQGSPATAEAVANTVAPAVLMVFRTIVEATIALDEQELEPDRGIPYAGSPPDVTRLAAAFQAESAANLRYVDALLVEPLARSAGIAEDVTRRRVASVEPDYLIADTLSRTPDDSLLRDLVASWGEGSVSGSLLTLAGHTMAYQSAAFLIAKYDSLAVHVDDTGKIDAVRHAEAFRNLLANARRSARASARAARIATGAIPVQARLAYQFAAVEEAGSIDDQINALAELWTASAFCQVAVMLARY